MTPLIVLKITAWLTASAFVLNFTTPMQGSYYVFTADEHGWAEIVDVRYVDRASNVAFPVERSARTAIFWVYFAPGAYVDLHSGESH